MNKQHCFETSSSLQTIWESYEWEHMQYNCALVVRNPPNTDCRLYQVSQISKKQHFTRFTTQPWPFQALLILVNPNHHSHHDDTHISDPFSLLVDTPHLTNAVPIAGRVLKKRESQFENCLDCLGVRAEKRQSIWKIVQIFQVRVLKKESLFGKLFRLFRCAC